MNPYALISAVIFVTIIIVQRWDIGRLHKTIARVRDGANRYLVNCAPDSSQTLWELVMLYGRAKGDDGYERSRGDQADRIRALVARNVEHIARLSEQQTEITKRRAVAAEGGVEPTHSRLVSTLEEFRVYRAQTEIVRASFRKVQGAIEEVCQFLQDAEIDLRPGDTLAGRVGRFGMLRYQQGLDSLERGDLRKDLRRVKSESAAREQSLNDANALLSTIRTTLHEVGIEGREYENVGGRVLRYGLVMERRGLDAHRGKAAGAPGIPPEAIVDMFETAARSRPGPPPSPPTQEDSP